LYCWRAEHILSAKNALKCYKEQSSHSVGLNSILKSTQEVERFVDTIIQYYIEKNPAEKPKEHSNLGPGEEGADKSEENMPEQPHNLTEKPFSLGDFNQESRWNQEAARGTGKISSDYTEEEVKTNERREHNTNGLGWPSAEPHGQERLTFAGSGEEHLHEYKAEHANIEEPREKNTYFWKETKEPENEETEERDKTGDELESTKINLRNLAITRADFERIRSEGMGKDKILTLLVGLVKLVAGAVRTIPMQLLQLELDESIVGYCFSDPEIYETLQYVDQYLSEGTIDFENVRGCIEQLNRYGEEVNETESLNHLAQKIVGYMNSVLTIYHKITENESS
jgi:hypothetical protein